MKTLFRTCIALALGAILGNVLYVHTLGDPGDYHWMRSFVFAAFFAAVLVLRRHFFNK